MRMLAKLDITHRRMMLLLQLQLLHLRLMTATKMLVDGAQMLLDADAVSIPSNVISLVFSCRLPKHLLPVLLLILSRN